MVRSPVLEGGSWGGGGSSPREHHQIVPLNFFHFGLPPIKLDKSKKKDTIGTHAESSDVDPG